MTPPLKNPGYAHDRVGAVAEYEHLMPDQLKPTKAKVFDRLSVHKFSFKDKRK